MKLTSKDFWDSRKSTRTDVASASRKAFGITESLLLRSEDIAVLRVGELEIIFDMCVVTWKESPVELSVTLLRILHRLAVRPGIVKTRSQLLDEVWGADSDIYDRTVDQHIKRLRKAFRDLDPDFDEVETVYGMGWRWRYQAVLKRSIVKP
jgi:DNA-binding response OmpR family regulator